MEHRSNELELFHLLNGEAVKVEKSAYGSVGTLFSGEGMEAVWVSKQNAGHIAGLGKQNSRLSFSPSIQNLSLKTMG